jgi:hypothetical protein
LIGRARPGDHLEMKKAKKIRLVVEREVLCTLQAHELRLVQGGDFADPRLTGDSRRVCCA